jgi:N-acetylglucosamine kinase-like BadF-type ATPase
LHQCIQNELSAQDVAQIKRAVYGHERPRGLVASLAKSVVELAAEGIESACVICDQAIDDLVELVARTNKLAGAACQNPLISATGGLLSSEAFRNRLSQQIERRLPGGAVVWIDDVAWLCVQQLAANCP